jgi:hypothetical protein
MNHEIGRVLAARRYLAALNDLGGGTLQRNAQKLKLATDRNSNRRPIRIRQISRMNDRHL